MASRAITGAIGIFTLLLGPYPGMAQAPDRNAPHVRAVEALSQILEQSNADIGTAAAELLDPGQHDSLLEKIGDIRQRIRGQQGVDVSLSNPTRGQLVYEIGRRTVTVDFELTETDPCLVTALTVAGETAAVEDSLAWETLESQLDVAAKQMTLDGAVLIVRSGEIVLNKAWGMANREQQIANRPDTIFAIGSAPIDFTHAGIRLLADRGKLDLDDPITRFFDNVPDDKQSITIRHLMTGGSGLPDFHDIPSDENPDHTWIDRDEAIRRIMDQKLLFKPGTGDEHSHSAWGLLAAIIEIASGQTYQEFSRQHLYEPAGLTDTGFFGDPMPVDRVAIGYGFRKSSEPNSPPNWGKTSWLVMGSGGQVATLPDMYRWAVAIRSGKILSPESTRSFIGNGNRVSADGDMFGFEFMHSHDPDSMFLLISNSMDSRDKRRAFTNLARQLVRLVQDRGPAARYSLGISMAVHSGRPVTVEQLVDDGAAARDGLQPADQLLSANGQDLGDEPLAILEPMLQDGSPIEFSVQRGDETLQVTVRPNPVR